MCGLRGAGAFPASLSVLLLFLAVGRIEVGGREKVKARWGNLSGIGTGRKVAQRVFRRLMSTVVMPPRESPRVFCESSPGRGCESQEGCEGILNAVPSL